jgi:hypothetical protein
LAIFRCLGIGYENYARIAKWFLKIYFKVKFFDI